VSRCSDGADRLREHWDKNDCAANNISSIAQCSNLDPVHIEWRTSDEPESQKSTSSSTSLSTGAIAASIVISVICVLLLLGLALGFVYLYGLAHPGGLAARFAYSMQRKYKQFDNDKSLTEKENQPKNEIMEKEFKTIENNNNNNSSSEDNSTVIAF
ncbi:Uncharacterized protein FKW44_019956, partial [Caligus rogercresseyi]